MMRAAFLAAAILSASPAFAQTVPMSASQPAAAADARAIRAADHLMALSGNDTALDMLVPRLVDSILPVLVRGNSGQQEQIRAILREELISIMKSLRPDFMANIRQAYLRHFSAGELEDMAAFMETPTGRKMTSLMPTMNAELFAFGQGAGRAAVRGAMPRIVERMRVAKLNIPSGT